MYLVMLCILAGDQEDLGYIHDVGFGAFSSESAPGLLEILHQKGINKGLVVDLGCGSGIWAKALTQAGYDVLGVLKFYNNCKELAFKSELFMDMENSNSVKPKSDLSQRKHKFSLGDVEFSRMFS
ncbi:class I SAM-dependent methyltransferase [Fischerella thermalis WC542]|nr:class I SAM-dependent methyltransferase [Fischerella thermalis WC114]PLZ11085.1 class I SAM-dependent methyltransferase [Fischerella thermalis WC1110]PLZ13339.1 class I SAM-dependent methyltransferase [Fischerella thermalis WC119]PLZ17463.1 class I SAM-dependent methyltransferase [Fischerella thermalis WC157]PLZ20446.1 class I SAM-dependent methyltransferase [Fischerella thermalis WC341]PLZ33351.1 class I SAM-dependent methyltransferase [Fischerella thermalis WC559]PLZ34834.1 class I SAM-d